MYPKRKSVTNHHTLRVVIGSFRLRYHTQHLCDTSPWPLVLSIVLFGVTSGFVMIFRLGCIPILLVIVLIVSFF